jgi:hypothetical protein
VALTVGSVACGKLIASRVTGRHVSDREMELIIGLLSSPRECVVNLVSLPCVYHVSNDAGESLMTLGLGFGLSLLRELLFSALELLISMNDWISLAQRSMTLLSLTRDESMGWLFATTRSCPAYEAYALGTSIPC